ARAGCCRANPNCLWLNENGETPDERVCKMGSAGVSPALVGDPPTGTAESILQKRPLSLARTVAPVPSGGSPDGTGGSPVLPETDFSNTLLGVFAGYSQDVALGWLMRAFQAP